MGKKEKNGSNHSRQKGVRSVFGVGRSIPSDARRGIAVVFLFAVGTLFALSLMGLTGMLGSYVHRFLSVAFGVTNVFVPFSILLLGVVLLRKESIQLHMVHIVALGIGIAAFTAFWHLSYAPQLAWSAALEGKGGGVVGTFLSYALQTIVGFWGAIVLLIAIFLSALIVIINTSLADILRTLHGWLVSCREGMVLFFSYLIRGGEKKTAIGAGSDDRREDGHEVTAIPDFSRKTVAILDSEKEPPRHKQEEEEETVIPPQKQRSQDVPDIEIMKPKRKYAIQLSLDLLSNVAYDPLSVDIKNKKIIIQKTLENFGIPVEMGEVNVGPTVTQFTLKPAEGVKLSSLTNLHNDFALALAAHPIRIEAPIPGKSLVGVEVPNQRVALVTLRQMLESDEFKKRKNNATIALGKDVAGTPRLASVLSMPHLLIAGSTGSGKTVCINTLIMTLLFQNSPDELRFIMIDPKRVELPCYNDIPHLLTPVITDVKKIINALRWTIREMERRFDLLSKYGKRDLTSYNKSYQDKIPYIVVIIDELADIMVSAGAEAESLIIRLAQMARAVGIHLVLATQRPSVDVITGLIKANITTRIAFAVASQMDSRTILDMQGAEKLVGRGDMLFISSELSKPLRIQGAYVSDDEIERVVQMLKSSGEPSYEDSVTEKQTVNGRASFSDEDGDDDELLDEAREVILQAKKASASLLQRRLRVGYARAARLLDLLENQGFIGPADGAKPREVYGVSTEAFEGGDEDTDEKDKRLSQWV